MGCRADDAEALEKLYALKGREGAQPSLVLVDADGLLEEYAHPVPEIAWDLLRESAPESRPMTLVLPGGRDVAPALLAEDGSLAIRVVNEPFLQFILRGIDVPSGLHFCQPHVGTLRRVTSPKSMAPCATGWITPVRLAETAAAT